MTQMTKKQIIDEIKAIQETANRRVAMNRPDAAVQVFNNLLDSLVSQIQEAV